MKRPRTGIRSTRNSKTSQSLSIQEDECPPDQANAPHVIPSDEEANNIFCVAALADKQAGTIYTDATGALPTILLDGHQYYFIAYDYDSNYIFAEPIKDVNDATLVEAFQKVFETLEYRGMKPTLNITDNQAVKPIKAFLGE